MFRRLLITLSVICLVMAAWTVPAAAKTETYQYFIKGYNVFAVVYGTEGCFSSYLVIDVFDVLEKEDGKPQSERLAYLNLYRFNNCTNEAVFSASGEFPLSPGEFVIDKKLSQASLNATIPTLDSISGNVFPVDINILWTGIGETSNSGFHYVYKQPDFKQVVHFVGSFREAGVTGTVSLEEFNFLLDGFHTEDAEFYYSNGGTISIYLYN